MRVVVLGAGVVGVTTAWQLLEDGHEVIDRQVEAACETSFANAGHIAVGHALAWANPRALKTLLGSLVKKDQPLRFRLQTRLSGAGPWRSFASAPRRERGTTRGSCIACAATRSRRCTRWSPRPGWNTTARGLAACICIAPRRPSSAASPTCGSWLRPASRWRCSIASARQ